MVGVVWHMGSAPSPPPCRWEPAFLWMCMGTQLHSCLQGGFGRGKRVAAIVAAIFCWTGIWSHASPVTVFSHISQGLLLVSIH